MKPAPIRNALIKSYLADMRRQNRSPRGIASYTHDLRMFERWLGDRDPLALDKNNIRQYMDTLRDRGMTTKSVGHYLASLSSFYSFLIFEERLETNPVTAVQKRYLSRYKKDNEAHTHKLISIEEAARLMDCLVDIRDKAIVLLFLKTGIRLGELVSLDVSDVDLEGRTIILKPTGKRSNRTVFFDDETARILHRWLMVRALRANGRTALFPGIKKGNERIDEYTIYEICVRGALRAGLHDPASKNMEDHFSPHCCRHWFTTHLLEAGLKREYVKELRGDSRKEAIDIYHHINKEDLKREYLRYVPQLGV